MKRFIFIVLIFSGFYVSVFAQDHFFSVVISRGGNVLMHGSAREEILMGTVVRRTDQVFVGKDGYMALLHPSGGLVELQEPGRYSYEALEKHMQGGMNTVLAKYCRYLMEKISGSRENAQGLHVTGAVERGQDQLILLYLPNASDLYSTRAHFSWTQPKPAERFLVTIKNMFDEVVEVREVQGPRCEIDFGAPVFCGETLFIINVRDADNANIRSRDYGIKRLSGDEVREVRDELEPILTAVDEGTALGNLLIASFFEERNLLIDASTFYKRAIEHSVVPGNYQQLYAMYLRRNRLSE